MLWTTPKTLEIEWRNRLKDLWIRSGLHSRKVELSHVKYFHAFLSTLSYVSPISADNDKRRWSWDGGGPDRELSSCLPTNYKKPTNQDKAVSLPPASQDYGLCHVICYLFKKLKRFLHQFNSKNNGPVLLFKTILALMLFPVVCCNGLQGLKMDWNLGQQQDNTCSNFNQISTWLIQILKVTKKVTLK